MAQPFVMINLDKPRKLRLSMKAMIEFEKTNKIKLMDLGKEMSVEICAKLAYTMLKQEDSELTLAAAVDLLDEYLSPGEIIEKINEAMSAAFPEAKNVEKPVKR